MPAAVAALIALIVVVAVAAVILANRAIRMQWAVAAERLGIAVESTSFSHPRIAGVVDDFPVIVEVKGSGDSARTVYHISYPPLGAPFRLRREGGAQRILRVIGVQDVQVGDHEFDTTFDVATDAPEQLTTLLTPARRFSLLRLVAVHGTLVVTETGLEATTRKAEGKAQRIENTVRRLTATAQHLVGTAATPELDAAIAARVGGDLAESLDRMDRIVADHPNDLDARVLQADAALSAGDEARLRSAAEAVASRLPADREIEAMQAAAARELQPIDAPRSGSATPVTEADSMAMFDAIFGGNRLSFESEAEFATTYRGRQVQWRGTVKAARPYEEDLDFGDGPGTKAVITVASIQSDLYGNTEVDAVVALPADQGAPLARGDVVSFTGTLHKADAMMRNIFVRDGRLTGR